MPMSEIWTSRRVDFHRKAFKAALYCRILHFKTRVIVSSRVWDHIDRKRCLASTKRRLKRLEALLPARVSSQPLPRDALLEVVLRIQLLILALSSTFPRYPTSSSRPSSATVSLEPTTLLAATMSLEASASSQRRLGNVTETLLKFW